MTQRIIYGAVFASALATSVALRAQGAITTEARPTIQYGDVRPQPQRADPMTQRLATCVDVLSGVASGQLVDRAALVKSFRDAFEVANPGKMLDASMKVAEKPQP